MALPDRSWACACVTAVAAAVAGLLAALGLARLLDATQGGMSGLAGVITGMLLGPPLGALGAFTTCLVTLARGRVRRPGVAVAVMVASCVAAAIVGLACLVTVTRTEPSGIATAFALIAALSAYAGAALIALAAGQPATADPPAAA